MSQVALLRTYFTNSRDLLAFKMDPEIFSSGTYYRRMQTRTLIWETDASVLQMLQIAIFLQARARSQPVDRADAWFQLQSLKVIGTVPKKWRKGLFCCFLLQSWCHFDLEAHRVAILLLSCMKSRSSVSLSSNNLEAATWSVCADWIKRVWDTGLDVQSHISAFLRSDWLFWFCFVFFFLSPAAVQSIWIGLLFHTAGGEIREGQAGIQVEPAAKTQALEKRSRPHLALKRCCRPCG